jgi:predicted nucleotidyltransferase
MPQTRHSVSNTLTLDQAIAWLARRRVVDGIVVIGSAGQNALTPASDYDLLVVLADMPVPLHVALTYIDRRLTDVIFVSVADIDRLLTSEAQTVPAVSEEGKLIWWLQTGRIAFDRLGRLRRAQAWTQSGQRFHMASEGELYSAWFGISYDVMQTKRMLASADPTYVMMVDLRLLFSLHDLWLDYFRVRKLLYPGKEAIRYLADHDPSYLELFRQCLAEIDRQRKVQLYEQLARLTIAPVGDLWEEGRTAVQLKPGVEWRPGMVEDALAFWEGLFLGREESKV